jgi:pimeloyl-ACP methyl ester carboxylesterase
MSARSVVLVPGLWMPALTTGLLGRRLGAAGYRPYRFAYRSVSMGLDDNAQCLAEYLERVPGDAVDFVGHSLGGIVILTMLTRFAFARAGRVVCLGSPLAGSRAAVALARYPGGRYLVGRSLCAYRAERIFARWAPSPEIGVIAGSLPFGAGRWVAHFDVPNDGTVAVDETRLAGSTDHITLPVTHMMLLWSAAVAAQAAYFLAQGRFAHERLASAASS